MKVRALSACVSTALVISFSSSAVFAQAEPVSDRGSLIDSDTIYWGTDPNPPANYYSYLIGSLVTPNVSSVYGIPVAVSHVPVLGDSDFEIYVEPSIYFRDAGFQDGDYLLSTFAFSDYDLGGYGYNNDATPSNFDFSNSTESICGFGTEIAPAELGIFKAQISAYDDNGTLIESVDPLSPQPFVFVGDGSNLSTEFIGLDSTTAINRVEIVVTSTKDNDGSAASWYAINQVTLTYCSDLPVEPEVPALTCDGFAAPMANYPVTAKKNRVFPLKMELFDEDGVEQTDVQLVAAPVVVVTYDSESVSGTDVSDLVLSAGQGSDGNQFDFTNDGIWQFNLKSKNYSSPGTYTITVTSGDALEYVIDETCETQFIIN